ncbi:protein of unknown function DUF970 [Thermobaculum terrenum ATCC BAA-798]|uniref:Nitrogen regulatory protein P-II n=1 Tax=Thermobaculum terrenum (strain ATCC BAA-798 / CCMEE 7001 / YNP1) TaxID=525904 RepID=D1CGA8_THET1|nr:cyclic-di-AMP receptor [Thermobaculum terrenum]ACZ41964.1 protein of unknown function DUF970 [Thermobaculum terrenum ATCC BAA-798]
MTANNPKNQKLVITVVQKDDGENVLNALHRDGYASLLISSSGGFLRRGNATILTLCSSEAVDKVIKIIADHASERTEIKEPNLGVQVSEWYVPQSVKIQRGGASIWVLDAELAGYVRAGAFK